MKEDGNEQITIYNCTKRPPNPSRRREILVHNWQERIRADLLQIYTGIDFLIQLSNNGTAYVEIQVEREQKHPRH